MNILFSFFYNTLFCLLHSILPVLAYVVGKVSPHAKVLLFLRGQMSIEEELGNHKLPENGDTIWIHCASLGEFGIARPIVKGIKNKNSNIRICVTFFSPSGYEVLKKKHPDIDYVYYLPLDTPENACKFLDIVKPSKAVFMVSELWLNYLKELKRRQIQTYLVSAQINSKSLLSKWYGGVYRNLLDVFSCVTTLSPNTLEVLKNMGYHKAELIDDPLCDNVTVVSQTEYKNKVLERFSAYGRLFIAGSVNDETDMRLMFSLINSNPDTRFVFVPHEVGRNNIENIKHSISGKSLSYSECNESTDLADIQVIIIDYVGELSYLYRYGTWAYVGGGFTPYLHNMLEATVYGLPVAFGPVIDRKEIALSLLEEKVGWIVRNEDELCRWFSGLKNNEPEMERINHEAKEFIRKRVGGTERILAILGIN